MDISAIGALCELEGNLIVPVVLCLVMITLLFKGVAFFYARCVFVACQLCMYWSVHSEVGLFEELEYVREITCLIIISSLLSFV